MKLVDILARKLKVWPKDCESITQDSGGYLYADQIMSDIFKEWALGRELKNLGAFEVADDFYDEWVNEDEWQAAVDALAAQDMHDLALSAETAEWNGEGDPPADTICELRNVHAGTDWSKAKIVFASRNVIVWDWDGEPAINGLCTAYRHAVEIRPVSTAEQIAAEDREKSINFMMADGGVDDKEWSRMFCAALYDSGYRKQ